MPQKKAKKDTVTNYRNAKDGTFTSKDYVKKHPATTTTEHNPRRKSGKKK